MLQEVFAEVNRYNQSAATNARPIVGCGIFDSWCAYCDGWNTDGADNPYSGQIFADLDAAVAQQYRWPTTVVATVPPAAPTGLTATVGNGKITLTWHTVAFAETYTVQHAAGGGGPYSVVASNVTEPHFVHTSFTPGTPCFYRVTARNALGESPVSNTATATPTNGLPDVIVTAVNWTPAHLLSGTAVVFRATVKNQGSAPTPTSPALPLGVGFGVSSGGNYTWATHTAPLAVGASVTLTATGGADGRNQWPATPGPLRDSFAAHRVGGKSWRQNRDHLRHEETGDGQQYQLGQKQQGKDANGEQSGGRRPALAVDMRVGRHERRIEGALGENRPEVIGQPQRHEERSRHRTRAENRLRRNAET